MRLGSTSNGTKHSYQSVRTSPHYLDWDNQPIPLKIYSALEPIPLPEHLSSSGAPALSAIASNPVETAVTPTRQSLAEVLFLPPESPGEELIPAARCLSRGGLHGALYHIDLYLVCGDLEISKLASIISARRISRCGNCAPEIFVHC